MKVICFSFFFHLCWVLTSSNVIDLTSYCNKTSSHINPRIDKNKCLEKDQIVECNPLLAIQEKIEGLDSYYWSKMVHINLSAKGVNLASEQVDFVNFKRVITKEFSQSEIII